MVKLNEIEKMLQDSIALLLRNANNALRKVRVNEHRLPASDGVGADDGVDGLEVVADVAGGAAGALAQFVAKGFGDGVEEAGFVDGFEGLEVFGEGGGEAVVDLVAAVRKMGHEREYVKESSVNGTYEAQRVSPPVDWPLKEGRVWILRMA